MANTAVGIGTGVTFTKGAMVGNVTNIAITGATRPSLSTAHLGSTISNPQIPGALTNWGSVAMDFNLEPGADIDLFLAEAQTTATPLVISFDGTAATDVFTLSAFTTDTDLATIPLEDIMTSSMTWQIATLPIYTP